MTSIALHPRPRWGAVAAEQVRAVGLRVRPFGALLVGALVMYAALAIRATRSAVAETNAETARGLRVLQRIPSFDYSPEISVLTAMLALLLAILVWHEEAPRKRMYHWSMPVSRSMHAVTKAFAGWVWAMVGTLLFLSVVVAVDAVTQNIAGRPIDIGRYIVAWEWLVPFTSVTVAYALASAATIGAETPIIWIGGLPILYACIAVMMASVGYARLSQRMLILFSGYYGAGASIAGQVMGPSVAGARVEPSVQRWLLAALLWGGAAAILVIAASRRRSETS